MPADNGSMQRVVYLNDRFLDADEPALVSLFDRGYLLGDSIFETLRTYGGAPFRLGRHLDRLAYSSRALALEIPKRRPELERLVLEAIGRCHLDEAYVRITVSRGEGGAGVSPAGCAAPLLSIVVRPLQAYPPEAYERGIGSVVVQTRRIPAECIDPGAKCGNYLPSVLGRRELDALGMIEGVQLGIDGRVVSGTVSNLFVVRDGGLRTPDLASGCLPGVTRATVIEVARAAGIEVREERTEVEDLRAADELFFTNTLMECLPLGKIDGRRLPLAPGPVTRRLQAALRALIRSETGASA